MMNKILTGTCGFVLLGFLSACAPHNATVSDRENKQYQSEPSSESGSVQKKRSALWGDADKQSLGADPEGLTEFTAAKRSSVEYLTGRMISVPAGKLNIVDAENSFPHNINVKAFKIGRFEVTQKQWYKVMGNTPSDFSACADCPVEQVSWSDVQKFISKLNRKTGQTFRLPSEAEWEYACRSGGKKEKYCGGESELSLAWFDGNSDKKTHSVGQKKPNGLGLYDMSGNVWEWVQDCWNKRSSCDRRIVRGGAWHNVVDNIRSNTRNWDLSDHRSNDNGFRLAQD